MEIHQCLTNLVGFEYGNQRVVPVVYEMGMCCMQHKEPDSENYDNYNKSQRSAEVNGSNENQSCERAEENSNNRKEHCSMATQMKSEVKNHAEKGTEPLKKSVCNSAEKHRFDMDTKQEPNQNQNVNNDKYQERSQIFQQQQQNGSSTITTKSLNGKMHEETHRSNEFYRLCFEGRVDEVKAALEICNDQGTLCELLDFKNPDDHDETPMHIAAEYGYPEMVRCLAKYGVNPDVVDDIGWTPLMIAALNGQFQVVQVLLEELHADVTFLSTQDWEEYEKGSTALVIAEGEGHSAIVELLRRASDNAAIT
mmetsp:Transcript_35160/g.44424  ORF Transcript_35160/g.44424 Transcript_35160/m.44424 type:complete len:309 (+) Transcript_35160:195-1121(+)